MSGLDVRRLTRAPGLLTALTAGLALALAHTAISLELGVSVTYLETFFRSVFLGLYPLGVSFMGLGALLERRLSRRAPAAELVGPFLRGAGACLLGLLLVVLRLNFFAPTVSRLALAAAAHLAALAAWFVCMGTVVAGLLRRAKNDAEPGGVGLLWAVHAAGLVLGYLGTDALVHAVGANAILLALGTALLLAGRRAPVALAVLLALAPAASVDARLETLRSLAPLQSGRIWRSHPGTRGRAVLRMAGHHPAESATLFRGWSRFGLVQIEQEPTMITGFYDFRPFWDLVPPSSTADRCGYMDPQLNLPPWRRALYGGLRPEHRILLLAAGGGHGVACLPFRPGPGVTIVELNEAVVDFMRRRPDLDDGAFRDAHSLARDGRFVVDTASARFDAVLVETGRFHTARLAEPAGMPQTLYTREAIERYLSVLKPGGLLLVIFNSVYSSPLAEYLPLQVERTLRESGMPSRRLASIQKGDVNVALAASSDPAVLDGLERRVSEMTPQGLRLVDWRPSAAAALYSSVRLTDDQPFLYYICMARPQKLGLLALALALALLPALLAGGAARFSDGARGAEGACFFLLGAAQVLLQIAVTYRFGSFLGDPVTTTIRVTAYLLLYGVAGALLSSRLARTTRGRLACAAAGGFALLALGGALLPFHAASAWAREAAALTALGPGGLVMGALFPAALSEIPESALEACLLADALGALTGYALIHLVMIPWGIRAAWAAGLALYGLAVAAFPRRSGAARQNLYTRAA